MNLQVLYRYSNWIKIRWKSKRQLFYNLNRNYNKRNCKLLRRFGFVGFGFVGVAHVRQQYLFIVSFILLQSFSSFDRVHQDLSDEETTQFFVFFLPISKVTQFSHPALTRQHCQKTKISSLYIANTTNTTRTLWRSPLPNLNCLRLFSYTLEHQLLATPSF